jgi:type IV secretion system protein VirB2
MIRRISQLRRKLATAVSIAALSIMLAPAAYASGSSMP